MNWVDQPPFDFAQFHQTRREIAQLRATGRLGYRGPLPTPEDRALRRNLALEAECKAEAFR